MADEALDTFSIRLPVVIRPCREEDLPALEALGLGTAHQDLIRPVFAQYQRGEALMLVAQVNGEAAGQLWVDLERRRAEGTAEIWAVRVLPCLRGHGLGGRMIRAAEELLRERGFRWALLGVETDNLRARHLYERLGYTLAATVPTQPEPLANQWVLRKELSGADPLAP